MKFSSAGFKRYFRNTSWLMLEKILRMGIGLVVGVWVARHLGPEKFGLLNYAQSFVFLFVAFSLPFISYLLRNEFLGLEKSIVTILKLI